MNETLAHEAALLLADNLNDAVSHALTTNELRQFRDIAYTAGRAMLEAYLITVGRERQRLSPRETTLLN